jgi:hypothetical protein
MFETNVVEKLETHFMCNKFLFNLAALEIMWKNVVERGRAQITT